MEWFDANYVLEQYNNQYSDSYHDAVAIKFKELLDRASEEIAKQDRELAEAKARREKEKQTEDEGFEMIH